MQLEPLKSSELAEILALSGLLASIRLTSSIWQQVSALIFVHFKINFLLILSTCGGGGGRKIQMVYCSVNFGRSIYSS